MKTDARETLEGMVEMGRTKIGAADPADHEFLQAALWQLVEMHRANHHGDNYPALARMVLAITELDLIETEVER